jgi:hypothetical protein
MLPSKLPNALHMCCGRGGGASAATEQAPSTGRARAAEPPAAGGTMCLLCTSGSILQVEPFTLAIAADDPHPPGAGVQERLFFDAIQVEHIVLTEFQSRAAGRA